MSPTNWCITSSFRPISRGRELVIEAYGAVRTLRQVLANHPRLRAYEVPDWLFKGDIWTQ